MSDKQSVGFLQDDKGNNSSMRLMAVLSLFSAIAFSGAVFWRINQNYVENAQEQARYLDLIEQEVSVENPNLEEIISGVDRLDQLNQTERGDEGMAIIWAFLGAAFGGKFAQKWAEASEPETMAPPANGPQGKRILSLPQNMI
jgi:hypothetical protein